MKLNFDPQDASFNRTNAIFLAHAADVAYDRSPSTAARQRLGLEALSFRHTITRTRGFLGLHDDFAVLAFRGSDPVTLPNWITDLVVKLVEREEYEGKVHRGFSSALTRSWKQVSTLLNHVRNRPLFLTGHSMGGALAVLAACRLAKAGVPPVATYTFGAPRIGDPAFCSGYRLPTYRIVNGLDLIPEMPIASMKRLLPATPKLTNERVLTKLRSIARSVRCYGHVRTLVYIDRDGEIIVGADIAPWHAHAVAHAVATRGKGFLDGIKDHLLSSYIRGLEGSLTRHGEPVRRVTKPISRTRPLRVKG